MKLTVIIPVFNEEKLLKRALDSIPSAKDTEIIIIDDGSTDNSLSIADKWRSENKNHYVDINLIHFDKNKGVAAAMNTGFDLARGEYIVSLSSDDYYVTDFEMFRPYLDGKNDLIYFDFEVNDGSVWHLDEESKKEYVGAAKFIRREFLSNTRIPDMKWHEDYPFSHELYAKNPKEVFTGIVLKHYNFPHEGSLIWQAEHGGKK